MCQHSIPLPSLLISPWVPLKWVTFNNHSTIGSKDHWGKSSHFYVKNSLLLLSFFSLNLFFEDHWGSFILVTHGVYMRYPYFKAWNAVTPSRLNRPAFMFRCASWFVVIGLRLNCSVIIGWNKLRLCLNILPHFAQ